MFLQFNLHILHHLSRVSPMLSTFPTTWFSFLLKLLSFLSVCEPLSALMLFSVTRTIVMGDLTRFYLNLFLNLHHSIQPTVSGGKSTILASSLILLRSRRRSLRLYPLTSRDLAPLEEVQMTPTCINEYFF